MLNSIVAPKFGLMFSELVAISVRSVADSTDSLTLSVRGKVVLSLHMNLSEAKIFMLYVKGPNL